MTIMKDILSFTFWAAKSRSISIHYPRFGEVKIKHRGVLYNVMALGKYVLVASTLGITHFSEKILYISPLDEILLTIQAAGTFFRNERMYAPFTKNFIERTS